MSLHEELKFYFTDAEISFSEAELDSGQKYLYMKQALKNAPTLEIILSVNEPEDEDDCGILDIYIFNICEIDNPDKEKSLLRIINKYNIDRRFWRLVLSDEGKVQANFSKKIESVDDFTDIIPSLIGIIKELDYDGELRRELMNLQWS